MPNTLAHIGVQGITTKSIFKFADLKWIYVGCIIPDFPWIIQKILRATKLFNLFDVGDYSTVLATFFFCIILSAAISLFSINYKRVFLILVFSSLFHLLLDPLQIKWGNGVHLFAPFSWNLLSFNLFWPESLPTYIMTSFGLIYFVFTYKKAKNEYSDLILPGMKKILLSVFLLIIYFTVPVFMLNLPEQNNNHFVETLRNYSSRTGKFIELDRVDYITHADDTFIRTFTNEEIKTSNLTFKNKGLISIKGKFLSPAEIYVEEYHINSKFRDDASILGISLTAILWFNCIFLAGKKG
jgi:hypothetical protein